MYILLPIASRRLSGHLLKYLTEMALGAESQIKTDFLNGKCLVVYLFYFGAHAYRTATFTVVVFGYIDTASRLERYVCCCEQAVVLNANKAIAINVVRAFIFFCFL